MFTLPRADQALPRRRSYQAPPIHERIAEVHVIPGPTTVGLAKDALAKRWQDFPIVEEFRANSYEFTLGQGPPIFQEEPQTRLRYWSNDRKRLLQAGRELFAANDLLPEPGWDELGPLLRRGYRDFAEVMQPREIVRGVLRYLNRVRIPEGKTAADLFTIFPQLPEGRAGAATSFQMAVDMGNEKAGPAMLSLAYAGSSEVPMYVLNLVVDSGRRPLRTQEALFDWAELAHSRMTELFDQSITEAARSLFGERG